MANLNGLWRGGKSAADQVEDGDESMAGSANQGKEVDYDEDSGNVSINLWEAPQS